jgi:hypothetical protein
LRVQQVEARLVGRDPDRAPVDDRDALASELDRRPLEPVARALGVGGRDRLEGLEEVAGLVDTARLRPLGVGG